VHVVAQTEKEFNMKEKKKKHQKTDRLVLSERR
jgi:hypothetical protein